MCTWPNSSISRLSMAPSMSATSVYSIEESLCRISSFGVTEDTSHAPTSLVLPLLRYTAQAFCSMLTVLTIFFRSVISVTIFYMIHLMRFMLVLEITMKLYQSV